MKKQEKAYWVFKFIQLLTTFSIAILLIILVAIPTFQIDLQDGLLLFTSFAGVSWLSNNVTKGGKNE